ncbi:phosphotransferase, partial [Halobium palmae]
TRTTLTHGDYRPGDLLFAGVDRPALTGVLDWETALLGDPLMELGYFLLDWRRDDDPRPPLDDLEARYTDDEMEGVRNIHERGLSPFTSKPGSLSRAELVARYEERTGVEFERERFYRAQAAFALATVWADLHRLRVEAGAGDESGYPPLIDYMALVAAQIADGEYPL